MNRTLLLSAMIILAACSNQTTEVKVDDIIVDEAAKIKPVSSDIKSGPLGGTWLNAGDNTPMVIIVPGSGPTNKDGNGAGFVSNSYKFLAEGLAASGISTVRVDKYGMFSSQAAGDGNKASVDIYAENYRSWAKTMTERTGQDCVFLLGHSEGGLMVTAAALEADNICGVILVAAPGFRLSDVMRKQLKDNPANAPILDDALSTLDRLDAGETVDVSGMHPALQQLFSPLVQDYLISLFAYDPADFLSKIEQPKIVIQGSHDIQVSVEDAKRLSELGGAELVILDGLSHVLKAAPAEPIANMKSYNSPETPIDPAVVKTVADFVNKTP